MRVCWLRVAREQMSLGRNLLLFRPCSHRTSWRSWNLRPKGKPLLIVKLPLQQRLLLRQQQRRLHQPPQPLLDARFLPDGNNTASRRPEVLRRTPALESLHITFLELPAVLPQLRFRPPRTHAASFAMLQDRGLRPLHSSNSSRILLLLQVMGSRKLRMTKPLLRVS